MELESLIKLLGAATGLIALLFAILKTHQWLYPIKITPWVHYPCEEFERGAIVAEIVNKSRETHYVVRCEAVGVNTLKHIIKKHLSHPFAKPRLYKTIRYGAISFPLIHKEKLKIEPYEPKELTRRFSNDAISYFTNPLFIIEVELSTGRKLQSKKQKVPSFWHYTNRVIDSSNNA